MSSSEVVSLLSSLKGFIYCDILWYIYNYIYIYIRWLVGTIVDDWLVQLMTSWHFGSDSLEQSEHEGNSRNIRNMQFSEKKLETLRNPKEWKPKDSQSEARSFVSRRPAASLTLSKGSLHQWQRHLKQAGYIVATTQKPSRTEHFASYLQILWGFPFANISMLWSNSWAQFGPRWTDFPMCFWPLHPAFQKLLFWDPRQQSVLLHQRLSKSKGNEPAWSEHR